MVPLFLIVLGAALLLRNLGILPGSFWDYFWPLLIIAAGLGMLTKRFGRWHYWCCPPWEHDKKEGNRPNT
ncbi:MAG: DUF5668 domain-containing protein [Chloroflexota bacterium]|nr:DUF5668 domain-containing protein [Chloroflexota bacterium]